MTPTLRVSDDCRQLVRPDGSTFFYLADTAWELFHRLGFEEADEYLRVRAEQQFTVIQAVALAEFDGLHTPNFYGHVPLLDDDPTRPIEDYFRHVDRVIDRAAELGLYTGLLPTWGDKVHRGGWGKGPEIFTPANARVYGEFLARRYQSRPIIWVLGGDRVLARAHHLLVYRAMAEGIRSVVGDRQLITFHPAGRSTSAQWVHAEPWLDFNLIQSGHEGRDFPTWDYVDYDRARVPPKPVLDGEPNYEDHGVMKPGWKEIDGWFDEYDVRKQAYRALLAGACGHTYGCHDVWQFLDPARNPPVNRARTPWRQAIRLPGANQMRHLRALLEPRLASLEPDQSLLKSDAGVGADHTRAARAGDGSWAVVYTPTGRPVRLDRSKLRDGLRAQWYDPRTGSRSAAREDAAADTFAPPSAADWMLVVE